MRFVNFLAVSALACFCFAQPVISQYSPENSASYGLSGLPGSAIAQGSIFSLFGTGLGPSTWVPATSLPLQTALAGTSVSVTVGQTTVNALLLGADSSQINAVLPSNTPTGTGTVTVTYNNQTAAAVPMAVVSNSFGLFTFNSAGYGQAVATDGSYAVNTIIHTFHPGDEAILWGTGLGPISGDDSTAPAYGNLPATVNVHLGNAVIAPDYAGRGGYSGLDQINFKIPPGVEGCSVPVAVETGGGVSNIATLAISSSGQTCPDSILGQDLVNKLSAGGTVDFGYVRMEAITATATGYYGLGFSDFAYASFSEFTPQTAGLANYGVSQGYCLAGWRGSGGFSDLSPGQLNAGPALTVTGLGSVSVPNMYGGEYYLLDVSPSPFLFPATNYTVSGPGGSSVDAFTAPYLSSTPSIHFTGITVAQTVPLASDFTLQWTGGDPSLRNGQVIIGGYSQASSGLAVYFQCTAPAAAQSFTIPAWVLSLLPPSGTEQSGPITAPMGRLYIGQYNNPAAFQTTGLDRGLVTDIFYNGYGVYFQ